MLIAACRTDESVYVVKVQEKSWNISNVHDGSIIFED